MHVDQGFQRFDGIRMVHCTREMLPQTDAGRERIAAGNACEDVES
jgi:hypothetical protein